MRNRNTIEFLGLWESLHNPNFNRVQFDTFRIESGLNRFVMTHLSRLRLLVPLVFDTPSVLNQNVFVKDRRPKTYTL